MKKIHVIGTVGIPASYGGWETLCENLLKHLGARYDFTVYCDYFHYEKHPTIVLGAKLVYIKFRANGVQSILYDFLSMLKSIRTSDVMLILGVSGCVFLPVIRVLYRGVIVVNIDGLEWKRDKWSNTAKLFLRISEYFGVKFSGVVVSDNKVIQQYIHDTYNRSSILIAYGADHASAGHLVTRTRKYIDLTKINCFKVCRIEPENNIHIILDAFSGLQAHNITIVGNWSNSRYGVELREKYSSSTNISLLDPIYDRSKLDELRWASDVYIHGHSAGGTNPSLVEAMYLGLPIVAFDVNFNRETTHNQCLYFSNAAELKTLILHTDIKTINTIGKNMKDIAMSHYTWKNVADQYSNIFSS